MNTVLICAVLAAAVTLSSAVPTPCSKLPKVKHDASKTLAPYKDAWMIIKSNHPDTDQCVNFQYLGYRNEEPALATALFINWIQGFHVPYFVRVDNDMDRWSALNDFNQTFQYRKLFIDYVAECFAIYTCDDNDFISDIRGLATNAEGVKKLSEMMATFDLPLKPGDAIVTVWNETVCNTPTSPMPKGPLKLGPLGPSLPEDVKNGEVCDNENIDVNGKNVGGPSVAPGVKDCKKKHGDVSASDETPGGVSASDETPNLGGEVPDWLKGIIGSWFSNAGGAGGDDGNNMDDSPPPKKHGGRHHRHSED